MKLYVVFVSGIVLAGCTAGLAMKAMDGIGICPPSVMQNAQAVDGVLQGIEVGSTSVSALEGLLVERQMAMTLRDGSGRVDALMYRTGHPRCRNMPTEEEFTPVMVKDGVVAGVGMVAYQQFVMGSSDVRDVTPEGPEEPMTFGRLYKSLPF